MKQEKRTRHPGPDTGGKSDGSDDIQEERDDNGGDDTEEDEDNEHDEEYGEGHTVSGVLYSVYSGNGDRIVFLLHNISSEEDTFEGGWYSYCNVSSWRTCRVKKDHHHVKWRHSGCVPALLEVSPIPRPED